MWNLWNLLESPLNMSFEMKIMGDKPDKHNILLLNFEKILVIKHIFEHAQKQQKSIFCDECVLVEMSGYVSRLSHHETHGIGQIGLNSLSVVS